MTEGFGFWTSGVGVYLEEGNLKGRRNQCPRKLFLLFCADPLHVGHSFKVFYFIFILGHLRVSAVRGNYGELGIYVSK